MKLFSNLLRIEYIFLFLILFGALFVRLYKIESPLADWHSWRQVDTASVSRFFVEDYIDLLHPRYHDISSTATSYENPKGWRFVEFPIFNALHALLFKTFDKFSFEGWGRLVAALSSLISTVFIYLIGRRFFGSAVGIFAAFFFAFLPFNVYFSRVILPEPLAIELILVSLWFFILWIDKEQFWLLFVSSVSFALALLVKPFVIFYAVPMLYLAITKFGIKGMILHPKLWMFFCISLIPFFFWRGWMNQGQYLVGIPHWTWAFNGDEIRFKPSFWWWIFQERLGKLILGGWGLIPFVAGLTARTKGKFPWFLHALVAGQIAYVSVIATGNVRHDYYQTFLIPVVALVAGYGTLLFWKLDLGEVILRRIAIVGCIVFALAFGVYQVKEFYKINHPEIILAGTAVDKLTSKDALVIAPYNGDTAFLYQTKRRGWAYVTLPIEKMVKLLGAQYYVSVNYDKQTKEIMEEYTVIEQRNEYVLVDLRKSNPARKTKL